MENRTTTYLPAAGHDWALPLYDPLVKLLGVNKARSVLLDQAKIGPTDRILDIGCGTGTMAIRIKQLHPDTSVIGFDPDPKSLALARHKAERSKVSVRFDQGFSQSLPYADASFDRVFSAFMFHHLQADQRETTFCEVRRVLKPGGSFHLVDFEGHEKHSPGWMTRLFHSSQRLNDNSEDRILTLMNLAGLRDAKKVLNRGLLLGALWIGYFQALAPAETQR